MTQNSGTLVIAPIRPNDSADTYPSAYANEIAGGWHSVTTTALMDAIATDRLIAGMAAYVTTNSSAYKWTGTAWSSLNLGGSITDGDKGDITVSSSGSTWTIDPGVVSYAKIQNVSATDRLLGRDSASAGSIEELLVGGGIEFTGTGIQRSALTGDVTATAGSSSTAIATSAVSTSKIADNAVTLAKFATQAAYTVIANVTSATSVPTAATQTQISGLLSNWNANELYNFKASVVTTTATSLTLSAASYMGRVLRSTATAAAIFSCPNDWPIGGSITVVQRGAGQVTFSAASGATLDNSRDHTKTYGIKAMVTLTVDSNSDGSSAVYVLAGDTGL